MKKKKDKFELFVWNHHIHLTFTFLVMLVMLLLCVVVYVQGLYINELRDKITELEGMQVYDYKYDIIPLEDFFQDTNGTPESLSTIYEYMMNQGYSELYLSKGIAQGEKISNCYERYCDYTLLRFNQKKGKYLEIVTGKVTNHFNQD